jgi:hypothetical protein
VLPLDNTSGDRDQDYFSGLREVVWVDCMA